MRARAGVDAVGKALLVPGVEALGVAVLEALRVALVEAALVAVAEALLVHLAGEAGAVGVAALLVTVLCPRSSRATPHGLARLLISRPALLPVAAQVRAGGAATPATAG